MQKFSVVIVCKNEADIIRQTLQSLNGLTDDIVVFDNGSTDNTKQIVKEFDTRLYEGSWEGYGKTKNKASQLAKYEWILSLDADESIDEKLQQSLKRLSLSDEKKVYCFSRRAFLANKQINHGEWGRDKVIRLYNRRWVNWNHSAVHEKLVLSRDIVVENVKGHILHKTISDLKEYSNKLTRYAMLSADTYYQQGKKAPWWKIRLSPCFTFLKYYIFRLGFMDGHTGYIIAKMTAWYTFLKYARLKELRKNK